MFGLDRRAVLVVPNWDLEAPAGRLLRASSRKSPLKLLLKTVSSVLVF